MTDRDTELGRALRGLEAPEHDPEFFAELRERLGDAPPRRARRAPRRRRLGFRVATAGALAAALLVVVLFRDGTGPAPRLGVQTASAAEVRAAALRSWAKLSSLSGNAVVRLRFGPEEPLQRRELAFWMSERGDLRTREAGGRHSGYDAATGIEVIVGDPDVPGPEIRSGLAPAAPDGHPSEEVLQRSVAAVVRALREGRGGTVREITFAGRPAWELRTPIAVNKLGYSGDALEVVVDRESGLTLRARETYRGRLVQSLRLSSLRPDGPPRIDLPAVPAGSTPYEFDYGFRRVEPAAVAAAVGYAPLVPGWLPDGFARAETVTAKETQPTGAEGMNPLSRDVVSAIWRRGLDRLVVTTRRVGSSPASWEDPLAPSEGYIAQPEPVTIEKGALAGTRAQVVLHTRAIPHLWARTPELVVTVSGDLSRAELLRVAASLAARGG
jgi:hypothetical protein